MIFYQSTDGFLFMKIGCIFISKSHPINSGSLIPVVFLLINDCFNFLNDVSDVHMIIIVFVSPLKIIPKVLNFGSKIIGVIFAPHV